MIIRYTTITSLPTIQELCHALPLPLPCAQQLERDKQDVYRILAGQDDRLLIIVGPCSAWPPAAVIEYAQHLSRLNQFVQHRLKLIMRVYTQKSRTTIGWPGPLYQPDPQAAPDIVAGLRYVRELMLQVLAQGLSIADEILFTHCPSAHWELLAWAAIGARSSTDPEHRIVASALPCAVGLKNPRYGPLSSAVQSVKVAQSPHAMAWLGAAIATSGNPYAHLVLRGRQAAPNYDLPSLQQAKRLLDAASLVHPAIIIDASHDNCRQQGKKNYRQQPGIIFTVIHMLKQHPDLRALVKGFMLESYLQGGKQFGAPPPPLSMATAGLSITDPCLSWEETEATLLQLADIA